MEIIAQVYGLIALLLMFISYQQSKKEKFLLLQIFANIFYGLQYFSLKAFSALATNIVSIIKTLLFYKKEKENKRETKTVLLIIESILIICGIFTYVDWYSIIPIIIACSYTYGTWQRNLKITYLIGMTVAVLWVIYNLIVGAYVAIIGSLIELTAAFLGFRKVKKNAKEVQ